MTDIKHLQKVILMIIKDIELLCSKHDIQYYLLGGSAIGAIRHKGFIPWDDDLDIIMDNSNYSRFLDICRQELDRDKYSLQIGLEDWPLYFSKIRLKGTCMNEIEGYVPPDDCLGIYVDIFKMDNVSSNRLSSLWQYFCAKYFLCYQLSQRSYRSASFKKRLMMAFTLPLRCSFLRKALRCQVEMYNNEPTDFLGFFYGRTRYKSGVIRKSLFGTPQYVPFEDTFLPVPEHYHEYLTQVFGNYMELPPEDKRVGLHMISIDFGKY